MARSGDNARIAKLGKYAQTSAPTFGTDLTGLANDVALLLANSVDTANDLPASGDYSGQQVWVSGESGFYVWDGVKWLLGSQWGVTVHGATSSGNSGGTYWSSLYTWTFPVAFAAPPAVTISASSRGGIQWAALQYVTATQFQYYILRAGAAPISGWLHWRADAV